MKRTRDTRTKKRLLMVTPYFVAHGGGIESVAWQLIRHLSNSSTHVTWMASDCDAPPSSHKSIDFIRAKSWNGIEERSGIPVPIWSLGACFRLWQAIRRSDIVHFHDIAYACSVLTTLFCLLQRKPYIITQHTGFVNYPSPLMCALRSWVNRVPGGWMLKRAKEVIFISDEVRRDFAPFLQDKPLHFIPNGVDTEIFHDQDSETRDKERQALCQQLGLNAERPLLLFVGRFVERKGIHLVLELSHQFPEYNWLFAGAGVLDPEENLHANGRVLRGLRGKQLANLYQVADLLLLPSYGEGFPLVVQESLACGTPVLVENALGEAAPNARAWMNLEKLENNQTDNTRWAATLRGILDLQNSNRQAELQRRHIRAQWAQTEWNWQGNAHKHQYLLNLEN